MHEEYTDYALMFKALSDTNRLSIMDYLVGCERCACEILEQLNITQSTLSYHMKILSDANIIHSRKEGKWMFYSLNSNQIEVLNILLDKYKDSKNNNKRSLKCEN